MLESLEVQAVIHCGDIGSPAVVEAFAAWPSHFVLGNCDYDSAAIAEAAERAGLTFHGRFGSIVFGEKKVAVIHGDDERRLREAIEGGQWDLVCTGHTHQAEVRRRGSTWVLNPGALYRANPHTLAVVDLEKMEFHHVKIA
jgi:hypothetical protein